jgi:hypothetical protein
MIRVAGYAGRILNITFGLIATGSFDGCRKHGKGEDAEIDDTERGEDNYRKAS